MKRCLTCGSTYADESLGYCVTDGALLVSSPSQAWPTGRVNFNSPDTSEPPTEILPANAPMYTPPVQWQPASPPQWPGAQAAPRRSNPWPWIIGGAALLLLIGLGSFLILYLSGTGSHPAPVNANNGNANQGASTTPVSPSNTASTPNSTPAKPSDPNTASTDSEEVLRQLTELENRWNDANLRGDRAAIITILADEFRGVGANNSVEDKKQYLANLAPNPTIKLLTLSDLKVSLSGNNAVLTGLNTAKFKNGQKWTFRFTDTFIWRDGRWQAISSQATRVK